MSKVALVTGGSMGLGLAVVERFARDGMEVVTGARHEWIAPYGVASTTVDVSDAADVELFVDSVAAMCGRIDVLVCNAAIYGPIGRLEDNDWDEWVRTYDINVLGTVLCCREVLPIMRAQGYGKIITLSGGGARPQMGCTAYNASKAAVVRFTEALAVELQGSGIDVNAVAPGVLDTRMRIRSPMPEDPAANMQRAVDLIAWLASSDSDGVTGRLFSAVWDDWRNLSSIGKDDYRMRREVPT